MRFFDTVLTSSEPFTFSLVVKIFGSAIPLLLAGACICVLKKNMILLNTDTITVKGSTIQSINIRRDITQREILTAGELTNYADMMNNAPSYRAFSSRACVASQISATCV